MKITEVILIEVVHAAGNLSRVLEVVGDAGLVVDGLEQVRRSGLKTIWELTVELEEDESFAETLKAIDDLPIASILGRSDRVFERHVGGKIETVSRVALDSIQYLRDVYTPGVARVCLAIRDDPGKRGTTRISTAIVTNGTAVLGLGDIGAVAGMPVMEGKAALFHKFSGLSGVPILIESKDPDVIVESVCAIAPSFGAIQLEDIRSPECFEIEDALLERLDQLVLHDDQHGTAVVTLAALMSATSQVHVDLKTSTVGQVGLGAAGIGIAKLLSLYGVGGLLGSDLNEDALSRFEALGGRRLALEDLMKQADIIVATTGVKGLIRPDWIREGQVILALTNPDPEIEPSVALERGASFAADGKAVNNVLGFPGLFRGALDARVSCFTHEMLVAASASLSSQAPEGCLVPSALDRVVHDEVARAVRLAAAGADRGDRP